MIFLFEENGSSLKGKDEKLHNCFTYEMNTNFYFPKYDFIANNEKYHFKFIKGRPFFKMIYPQSFFLLNYSVLNSTEYFLL